MAIIEEPRYRPMVGDPDDHRPESSWAVLADPVAPEGRYVDDITVILEHMAPGDRIPLHTHDANEVVVVIEGSGDYVLGDERRAVAAGACVFIPSGTPHSVTNRDDGELRLIAMFPSPTIDITYLDRNPAPGTEAERPQPPAVYDPRDLG